MQAFHSLSVKEIKRQTKDSVSVVFQVPESLKQSFQFTAGQYITLKTNLNGQDVRRSYSLCSTPDSGEIEVLVKAVPQGVFSTFVNSQLQIGDSLEVSPPEGRFVFQPNSKDTANYAAFAAGSGITPIISILKTGLKHQPESKFLLVYGNKSEADTIFLEELKDLAHKFEGRFFLELTMSRHEASDCDFGRIDRSKVNYYLANKHQEYSFNAFYLCGPEAMINIVSDTLKEKGVADSHIHYELFTSASSESDANSADIPEGSAKIIYTIDGEQQEAIGPNKESVLDLAIKNDFDAPYSCQGGICSSCIARVTEGTVEMRKNQILTDSEVAEGLVLTCQSHATSAVVHIDYDEV